VEPYEIITDHQLVLNAFGLWPEFNEAQVHRIVLDSKGSLTSDIELVIRASTLSPDPENPGEYKFRSDALLVHFLFENVHNIQLDGFCDQNLLDRLTFAASQTEPGVKRLKVELGHCYGVSGGFGADHTTVLSVAPYSDDQNLSRQHMPSLVELRARLPTQTQSAGEFVRRVRDSDRY
jgi:hypothetical protein